jgi:hypothetical protein
MKIKEYLEYKKYYERIKILYGNPPKMPKRLYPYYRKCEKMVEYYKARSR